MSGSLLDLGQPNRTSRSTCHLPSGLAPAERPASLRRFTVIAPRVDDVVLRVIDRQTIQKWDIRQ